MEEGKEEVENLDRVRASRKRDVPAHLPGELWPVDPGGARVVALPDLLEERVRCLDIADSAAVKNERQGQ